MGEKTNIKGYVRELGDGRSVYLGRPESDPECFFVQFKIPQQEGESLESYREDFVNSIDGKIVTSLGLSKEAAKHLYELLEYYFMEDDVICYTLELKEKIKDLDESL